MPVFSGNSWKLNCPLGECGMSLSTKDIADESRLVFTVIITNDIYSSGLVIGGKSYYLYNPKLSTVTFQCIYKSEVKITSEEMEIVANQANDKASAEGNLDAGFSIRNRSKTLFFDFVKL